MSVIPSCFGRFSVLNKETISHIYWSLDKDSRRNWRLANERPIVGQVLKGDSYVIDTKDLDYDFDCEHDYEDYYTEWGVEQDGDFSATDGFEDKHMNCADDDDWELDNYYDYV